MTQRRNHKGNLKILWDEWKLSHNILKLKGYGSLKEKCVYLKRTRSQINKQIFYLKKTKKEE